MAKMTRRELEARYNSVSDAIGPRLSVLDSGPERGCRIANLRNGDQLQATINLDRGMDLRDVWWRGELMSFTSPAGDSNPAGVENFDAQWTRTWPGGLLTTCGFRNVGPAEVDESGEEFNQHGRAASLSGRDVAVTTHWDGDDFVTSVSGTVRESKMFAEHIECRRTWTMRSNCSQITMHDEIRNNGFRPEHVLVMYHVNLGWPILAEGASVQITGDFRPRDPRAAEANADWTSIRPPTADFAEQVWFHDVTADNGQCAARLVNESLGAAFELRWDKSQLGSFTQWQSLLSGGYALGLEPGNCLPLGRTAEMQAGRGEIIEPGQTKPVDIRLQFAHV